MFSLAACSNVKQSPINNNFTNTISHRLIDIEEKCSRRNPIDFEKAHVGINVFLQTVVDRINKLEIPNLKNANKNEAILVLSEIDRTLSDLGYVFCIKTNRLSDTYLNTIVTSSPESRHSVVNEKICLIIDEPEYRSINISKFWNVGMKPIDCDLSSFLYYSVGEILDLPLTIVQVPKHSFIRWNFENSYLNWDTNDAREYSDNDYRLAYGINTKSEETNKYLENRTTLETQVYYHSIVIDDGASHECFDEFKAYLDIDDLYVSALAYNNFAWELSTQENARGINYVKDAVSYSLKSLEMENVCIYQDTLPCAFAANGLFEEAIQTEIKYFGLNSPRIKFFENKLSCYEKEVADVERC